MYVVASFVSKENVVMNDAMVHSTGLNNYSPKSKAHLEVKVSGKRW
jgi:hypothetical protein